MDKEEWTVVDWECYVNQVRAKMLNKSIVVALMFWALGVHLGVHLVQLFLIVEG